MHDLSLDSERIEMEEAALAGVKHDLAERAE